MKSLNYEKNNILHNCVQITLMEMKCNLIGCFTYAIFDLSRTKYFVCLNILY